jgi:hypothetical protein
MATRQPCITEHGAPWQCRPDKRCRYSWTDTLGAAEAVTATFRGSGSHVQGTRTLSIFRTHTCAHTPSVARIQQLAGRHEYSHSRECPYASDWRRDSEHLHTFLLVHHLGHNPAKHNFDKGLPKDWATAYDSHTGRFYCTALLCCNMHHAPCSWQYTIGTRRPHLAHTTSHRIAWRGRSGLKAWFLRPQQHR